MLASARKTLDFFNLKPGDNAWLCLPIEYIAGKMMVIRALSGRLNLLATEPSGTPILPKIPINFAAMVPLQVYNLLQNPAHFSSIKRLIVGGAALDDSLQKQLKEVGTEVYATYGMTETCSHIALKRINGKNPDRAFHALPGVRLSQNESGCLIIDAPELCDTPLETRDRVKLFSDRSFEWIARSDFLINSGGIKIEPEILEKRITKIIGYESIIIPQKDPQLGEKIVLVLEKKGLTESAIRSLLQNKLDKHYQPKNIRFIDHFPRNPSFKIDRLAIIAYLEKELKSNK